MDYFRDNRIINSIVRIKVVGVGGGGNSVLMRLAEERIPGIELLGVNTDTAQLSRLQQMGIPTLPIGTTITRGRGTGGSAKTGAEAAMLDKNVIARELRDVDLVFITAGLGSGVGTGAAPIVSQIAHNLGILTIGVVTAPFSFEGKRKMQTAEVGIRQLKASLDGLLVIHNDNLMKLEGNRRLSLADSFKAADNVLRHAIIGISELILTPGVINVDFADVTSIFRQSDSSDAIIGIGTDERGSAVEAVKSAIASPLIERSLDGARAILINITGGESMSLVAVSDASQYIYDHTHPNVNIIFGTVVDKSLGESIRVTLVATDFADSVAVRSGSSGCFGEAVREMPAAGAKSETGAPEMSNTQLSKVISGATTVEEAAQEKKGAGGIDVPDFLSRGANKGSDFPQFTWKR